MKSVLLDYAFGRIHIKEKHKNRKVRKNQMENRKKKNRDMETLVLTGIISIIVSFSLLLLAAIVTETDITLWDKTKAVPLFLGMSGLMWWYFWSNESKKVCKGLKKA